MVRRPSITGIVFSAAFASYAGWCLIASREGLIFIGYMTLPFSWFLSLLASGIQSYFDIDQTLLSKGFSILDCIVVVIEFYVLGWLLERPLRR